MSLPANRAAGLPSQIAANHVETSAYTADGLIPSGPLKGTVFVADGSVYQLQYGAITGATEMIASSNYGSFENPDERLRAKYERSGFLARAEYDFDDNTSAYVLADRACAQHAVDQAVASLSRPLLTARAQTAGPSPSYARGWN